MTNSTQRIHLFVPCGERWAQPVTFSSQSPTLSPYTTHVDIFHDHMYNNVSSFMCNAIESYLENRKQYVEFNAERSDIKRIKNGVPQDSILGALLFLIYINDLPNASHVFDCLMYADDTTLFCCLEDIKSINKQDVINEQLQRIHAWLTANGLKLNTTKSKYIMFRKQNKNIPLFNIHINKVNIESVQNFNFLELHLSSDMTWNFHMNEVSKKISRSIGILKKLQLIVPNSILLTIYNTLILPHINYCLLSWGSKSDNFFNYKNEQFGQSRVQILSLIQNRFSSFIIF